MNSFLTLMVDDLNVLIWKARSRDEFSGLHVITSQMTMSYLQFIYDTLLIGEDTLEKL